MTRIRWSRVGSWMGWRWLCWCGTTLLDDDWGQSTQCTDCNGRQPTENILDTKKPRNIPMASASGVEIRRLPRGMPIIVDVGGERVLNGGCANIVPFSPHATTTGQGICPHLAAHFAPHPSREGLLAQPA